MIHPQSPAYLLPEASEPVAWQHLKAYGYAPGNYMNKCHTCGKVVEFVDKRAITCRPCAEARHAAAPSPVAQAPAQAGEVALPHPGSPEASAIMDSMLAEYQHPANSKNAARAGWEAARRWLATQPLAAPVQQEAERIALLETALSEVLEFQSAPEGPHIFDWRRWRRIRENTPPFQRAALAQHQPRQGEQQ